MPEGEGTDLSGLEKILKESMGLATEHMISGIRGMSDEMKEFTIASQSTANTMGAMIQTMNNARYSFSEFMSTLEKTNIMMYSTAKLLGDVSSGFKYATGNVEGLISALQTLSTHTLPDVSKHVLEGIMGYKKKIEVLREDISHNENLIASMKRNGQETDAWGRSIGDIEKRTIELREELDETSEEMKICGASLNKIFGVFTLVVTAAVALTEAYDNAVKAKREVIYTLGRLGVSYSDNKQKMDAFEDATAKTAHRWGMLKDEMAKAIAPVTAMGVGAGPGGVETLGEVSKWTGGMFRGLGIETGLTTKAIGTFSTSLNLQGRALSETFADIVTQGRSSVLGLQLYLIQMTSGIESMRRYGASTESLMVMFNAFGEELVSGKLALQDITKLVTPSMWSTQQQGAMTAMLQQFAPQQAQMLGIAGKDLISGMVTMTTQAQTKGGAAALMEGLGKVVNAITPGGATVEQRQFFSQKMLETLLGIQVPIYKMAEMITDPSKLSGMLTKKEAKTPEALFADFDRSYGGLKTIKENFVGIVDAARGGIIDIKNFMFTTWGNVKSGQIVSDLVENLQKGRTSGILDILLGKAPMGTRTEEVLDKILETQGFGAYAKMFERKTKQTGGYIPETAMYMLEAGEQVRRPGEGGGAINITLGGINVSVGDRGDMRNQLDEAFERLKRETISEIESQWNESLVAH